MDPTSPALSESPGAPDLRAPPDVVWIARRLEDAGYATWAVGGAVRDVLSGRVPGDWDLATAARPGDVRRLFKRTVPIGIEHGTVGVIGRDGKMVEVTTFRRDVETDGRHARVHFSDTVEEDLGRRDFTINAVAWHPRTHEIRDPHGGVADLRAGLLRTVGDPAERFREDRLRVLRALRFAGRFGLRIDAATREAARAIADQLPLLSAERVREELMKTLREVRRPSDSLRLYEGCGALGSLYPELRACVGADDGEGGDVWTHLLRTADELPRHRATLRLAALLHDVGKTRTRVEEEGGAVRFPGHAGAGAALAREMMRRLKFSNAETDRTTHLVARHADLPALGAPAPEVRRWLRLVGPAHVADLLRLRIADARSRGRPELARQAVALRGRARKLLEAGAPLEIGDLAINGADLRALGLPPGPLYGEILRDLLERVMDDPSLNRRETLFEMVRRRIS